MKMKYVLPVLLMLVIALGCSKSKSNPTPSTTDFVISRNIAVNGVNETITTAAFSLTPAYRLYFIREFQVGSIGVKDTLAYLSN